MSSSASLLASRAVSAGRSNTVSMKLPAELRLQDRDENVSNPLVLGNARVKPAAGGRAILGADVDVENFRIAELDDCRIHVGSDLLRLRAHDHRSGHREDPGTWIFRTN